MEWLAEIIREQQDKPAKSVDPPTVPGRIGKLTKRQCYALKCARDKGNAWAGHGRRAGGAYARMCQRLADYGLLTSTPFELTEEGRRALEGT